MDQLRGRHAPGFRGWRQAATGRNVPLKQPSVPVPERVIVKHDSVFAVSAGDGSMAAKERLGDGLWFADTRILSEFRLLLGGSEPKATRVRQDGGWSTFELAAHGLHVTRLRYVRGGLRERITVTNPGPARVEQDLELVFGADFAAMLAVRGIVPDLPPPALGTLRDMPDGAVIERSGGWEHGTRIFVRPPGFRRRVGLDPGEELTLLVDVVPQEGASLPQEGVSEIDFEPGLDNVKDAYRQWHAESMGVRTDNPELNELFERSLDDLRMLCNRYPTGIYPTGGLPWFAVPFGRDPLITSMMMLPVNPEIARGVLRYQAANQGRHVNEDTEEQPGKILHEVRTGEVVERGLWPHILFGTVDATPLFLCTLAETVDWTGDLRLLDELWTAAEAALGWCANYGDVDGDGYIEYRGARAHNQGWKDSDDSLTNTDGTDPPRPAALCEVQGYLYRGLLGMARKRQSLGTRAAELRRRFNADFWMPREKFVAQALDGSKRQVQAITSNPGHCLWTGILEPDHAAHVADRLLASDMFSGWGVRTLSTGAVNYDRCSYHNGSVWPFDSALAAAGLRKSGFPEQAERVAAALLEAGMAFPLDRLPELWCGDARQPGRPPSVYWNSCVPQAWSAGSVYSLLSTLLGLHADAEHGRLRIAPIPTHLFSHLEVNGLHFAGHRLDFSVDGTKVKVGRLPQGIRLETA